MIKLLFILKKRGAYGISYGLKNSCKFVAEALEKYGIKSKIVEVIDNNCIDKEVHQYKPTHVFIEALWVVSEKFPVLFKLHPKVKWYVRLHSQVPFLGNEGVAFDWLAKYNDLANANPNFSITSNSEEIGHDINHPMGFHISHSPNIYLFKKQKTYPFLWQRDRVDIGCFGAIRPFKNHLDQALAAIDFANENDMKLYFHINSSRFESNGENVLRNLRAIFDNVNHELVEYEWSNHEDFIKTVRKMDVGMQVSFTETFNIIAADFVSQHVPLVGSKEIKWLHRWYQADPNDVKDIKDKLAFAYFTKVFHFHRLNEWKLNSYNRGAIEAWLELLDFR